MKHNIQSILKKFIQVFLIEMGAFFTLISLYFILKDIPSAEYMEQLHFSAVVKILEHSKVLLSLLMSIFAIISFWNVLIDLSAEKKRRVLYEE